MENGDEKRENEEKMKGITMRRMRPKDEDREGNRGKCRFGREIRKGRIDRHMKKRKEGVKRGKEKRGDRETES